MANVENIHAIHIFFTILEFEPLPLYVANQSFDFYNWFLLSSRIIKCCYTQMSMMIALEEML